MLVKTHVAVGVATALLIQPPTTIPTLCTAIAVSSLSGVICDIDADHSKAKKGFDKVLMFLFLLGLGLYDLSRYLSFGVEEVVLQNVNIAKPIFALLALLLICLYGKMQSHRGFMHSFACCFMITVIINWLNPSLSAYFCIAFLSHITIDLLNKQGEQLFWPFKWRGSLGFCKSDGIVNKLMLMIGIAGVIYAIYNCPPIQEMLASEVFKETLMHLF